MPKQIGKYEIHEELGRGGNGRVFRAYDPLVGRPVAIKILASETDREVLQRFSLEAAAAGNLHHRNIVTIYEFGQDGDTPFLAMEFLEGRNLQDVIANPEPLTIFEKVRIMSQVADALRCAHRNGVVHRDIKPANIMLTRDGTVKLMDFGIARVQSATAARLTQKGDLVGTLCYMSPEQFAGAEADALSDIFSFGVVYYELLTGKHPFPAQETASLVYKVMNEAPEPIRKLVGDCPEALESVVFRALEKDRRNRYQKMEDLQFEADPVLLQLQGERAESLFQTATEFQSAGKLEEAHELLREALSLVPSHREARRLRADLQAPLESLRRARQLTAEAFEKLAAGDHASALDLLSQALLIAPGNADALALQERTFQAGAARDLEREIRKQLTTARGLLLIREYDRAIAGLEETGRRHPEHAGVKDMLARARIEKLQHEAAKERALRLTAIGKLIDEGKLDEAGVALNAILHEDGAGRAPDAVLGGIEDRLLRARTERERAARRGDLLRAARSHAAGDRWDELSEVLEIALVEFAGEPEWRELLQTGASARQARSEGQARATTVAKAHELAGAGQIRQAMQLIHFALLDFPESPELRSAHDHLLPLFRSTQREIGQTATAELAEELAGSSRPHCALALLEGIPGVDLLRDRIRSLLETNSGPEPALEPSPSSPDSYERTNKAQDQHGIMGRATQVFRGFFSHDK